MSPNIFGALLMMASMACFTISDTFIKLTAGQVPLFQVLFLRGILTCSLILLARGRLGVMHMNIAARDWKIIAVRCLCEIMISYFFMSALFVMPLPNVTAIMQALPLSVTLASAIVLRETVGWQRMTAIGVGFLGVMMIVQPGAEGFNVWSIYVLIAVAFVTARDLVTRKLSPMVPSMTVTLATAASVTIAAGFASLSQPWAAISFDQAKFIAGSGVFILGGYFTSIWVIRVADVSFTAPFRYTGLVWALVLGWFVFDYWPGWVTLMGAAIVVATGLFTLYRERKLAR